MQWQQLTPRQRPPTPKRIAMAWFHVFCLLFSNLVLSYSLRSRRLGDHSVILNPHTIARMQPLLRRAITAMGKQKTEYPPGIVSGWTNRILVMMMMASAF
ncbi:hypothetical protein MCOR27_010827 [Pyricularia oryzae]|uniref:Uncharacterized protein n=1 Tax=Pyricularia grisea TaxID=148305 RepID=A0ABQ8NJG1_PYRGI|nr:hypothetical protein MCOR01_003853 [Pyricularia oryzae]KAI6297140.1 hypothetical protein MCOR33_006431 [Pyricularia grisea]KAH9427377.1 hypothetical protein MCOR02_012282 [Pyricularia oryzae]KAI6253118.1 hypothetical protein MCOR19_010296 [Pyricularia oryzae]KAI6264875.1 hypothetical protein MCOR26_011071 [Pyricularia oryzae]